MYKIIIACDKFKGSLTASEACRWLQKGILSTSNVSNIQCEIHPMADGGEGTLAILKNHLNLEYIDIDVNDPIGRVISTYYGVHGSEAYIETSKACGLQLLHPREQNPLYTNTYGVGQMILDAVQRGYASIHLFVGGSATTDGGAGMASALGYIFKNKEGHDFVPTGKSLSSIHTIACPNIETLEGTKFFVWADVSIPLYGLSGAAYMFAKQKGASNEEVILLDDGLRHLHSIYSEVFNVQNLAYISGAGAGGGLGAGCVAFLGASIGQGIDFIIEHTQLASKIKEADIIISGEGAIDDQSMEGKVVYGVARLCQKYSKPLILVCGKQEISHPNLIRLAPSHLYTILSGQMTIEEAILQAGSRLFDIGKTIGNGV